ncbi:hypothetical protein SAMN02745784_02750 [Tissierella praeacuta DSM 18095]|uniref:Uncharacterized protein n=1 Tax=Tissierella praeacuta DSM 18095 TaxID=1123404 RepID=A0A1M4YR52_9FIRM|nr:hypothetical protein [Tissierella praeacuta]TCU66976.1 hypothetical protein EV204_11386 [Tissierella praeacuta]SHF08137.1 hypothetical protein SAMN02745784_02750 [Tissierella praeacuta DSM 18095]SUP02447.1 Uncharacterised protein [Tissierella praeacuta]
MFDKGYFYEESSWTKAFAGSIIYNTSKSHVGLVTDEDESSVSYTDHSDVKNLAEKYFFKHPMTLLLKNLSSIYHVAEY